LEYSNKLSEEQKEELREERGKNVNVKSLEDSIVKIPLQKINEKQKIYDEVFEYKNKPTMTLEEFAELEMKDL
jgi:nitrate reductase assembly molybdenum cofactor insertion protein NarJ